ncbi:FAD-dependent monooxygenase [Celerinatantimonas sp. YJH-8]|uniref:FAD-dependent monooxygenase n=1 Tax=Celerinatantimonas sp. YJH-8 TaxID=3228714 RepID=UPI0038CBDF05
MKQYDVIIAGGGMIGAALACGLASQGMSIALLEPSQPTAFDVNSVPDLRLSAFNLASEQLLRKLGAWPAIEAMRLTPYSGLQTWEVGMVQRVDFQASTIGQDHLGYMIENRVVQLALWQCFEGLAIDLFPWQDWQLQSCSDGVVIHCQEQPLQGRLMIGADGAHSQVREQSGIGITGWNYRQRCLSINIKLDAPLQEVTWQEFHPEGPRAFLPLMAPYATLIWYDTPQRILQLQRLSAAQLKQQIIAGFPALPGDFELLNWASFPLTRQHAHHYGAGRVILAGDAAHTIHPLAGQGVNIGFKDVSLLLELLEKVSLDDYESVSRMLRRYQRVRQADNLLMQSAMDVLYKSFSHSHPMVGKLRRWGLSLAEHSGVLKRQALRYAVGLK